MQTLLKLLLNVGCIKGFFSGTVNPTSLGWTSGSSNLKYSPIPRPQKNTHIFQAICVAMCIAKHFSS